MFQPKEQILRKVRDAGPGAEWIALIEVLIDIRDSLAVRTDVSFTATATEFDISKHVARAIESLDPKET